MHMKQADKSSWVILTLMKQMKGKIKTLPPRLWGNSMEPHFLEVHEYIDESEPPKLPVIQRSLRRDSYGPSRSLQFSRWKESLGR